MLARTHEGKPGLPRGRSHLPPPAVSASQRERLLRSVIAAVSEHGYPAVTVADIVRRARVSKKAFYDHFTNKEECFLAATGEGRELMISRVTSASRALPAGASDEDLLRAACRGYLEFLADEPAFARVFYIHMPAAGAAGSQPARRRAPYFRRDEPAVARAGARAPPGLAGRPARGLPRAVRGGRRTGPVHGLRGPDRRPAGAGGHARGAQPGGSRGPRLAPGHPVTGSCPKHMVMGPCGGVRADGRCEVVPDPCVFPAPAEWAEPVPAVPLRAVPLILTDFSSEPYSVRMLRTVARTLAPSCDAVLVGEHQDRPDFPPTLLASMLQEAGARPWMTLACRDRNRIVLEEELSGLRHLGVDAVLCVTGDARAYDVRPDVTQVFDLDGPRLAALAASIGISAAVPETPAAPPRRLRAFRLAQKQRAGAAAAVLNHDTVASVTAFMSDAVRAGVTDPGHRLGRGLHR